MLKQGTFIAKNGAEYTTFRVEENGYERFDIVEPGAAFQIDYDKVLYSRVKRRKLLTFGNESLYNEYNSVVKEAAVIYCKTEKTTRLLDGRYYLKTIKRSEEKGYLEEYEQENGLFNNRTIMLNGCTVMEFCIDPYYSIKVDPMNIQDYHETKLHILSSNNLSTPYYPLTILKQRFDLRHIDDKDYEVVTDINEARERLRRFKNKDTSLRGFDTETTGLEVHMYGDDELVGVILAEDENTSTYYPFRHKMFDNLPMEFLKEIFHTCNIPRVRETLIAHNKKFDRQVMLKEGFDLLIKWDTLQLSIILNPIIEKGVHALKTKVNEILGLHFLELDEVFIDKKSIDFSVLPIDIVKYYACPDATNVIVVFKELFKELPKVQYSLFFLECDLSDLKADQEFFGLKVNVEKFLKSKENCDYVVNKLMQAFRILTRIDGNINSPDILRNLMYNQMGCEVLVYTETGKPSTSGAAIKKLAKQKAATPHAITQDITDKEGKVVVSADDLSKAKYPVLLILDKYREYNKRKTAFYARFERTMKVGRIFFWINQNGAESGRQSSPLHQLPPELKDVIMSDGEEYKFWGPDYSQVELRMLAYLANEKDLIELCNDSTNDIHRIIGSLISGKEMWEITPEERNIGKRRNFGAVYLISEFGLAGQLYGAGYTKEQVAFCKQQLDDFFKRFKRINAYIVHNRKFVLEHGYMETRNFKRRRVFKDVFNPDISRRRRMSIVRQANNMPVQGTAADLMKQAEVNMYKYLRSKGWYDVSGGKMPLVRPMLSIHDEIIMSAHESIPAIEIIKMITECMEIEIKGAPPFFVQPAHMPDWGGHADDSAPIPIPLRDSLIKEYEETGTSKINYDNYTEVLKDYRTSLLTEYMAELISKYGTDYKAVGAHVRHASLTHSLLEVYKKELKELSGLSHEESIVEATRMYIDELLNNTERKVTIDPEFKWNEDADKKAFDELESMVNFDENGEVLYEEGDEDADAYSVWDDDDYIERMTVFEEVRVWELHTQAFFDLSNLSTENADKVIQEVYRLKNDEGFFEVNFIYGGQPLKGGFNIEDTNKDTINKFIIELENVAVS